MVDTFKACRLFLQSEDLLQTCAPFPADLRCDFFCSEHKFEKGCKSSKPELPWAPFRQFSVGISERNNCCPYVSISKVVGERSLSELHCTLYCITTTDDKDLQRFLAPLICPLPAIKRTRFVFTQHSASCTWQLSSGTNCWKKVCCVHVSQPFKQTSLMRSRLFSSNHNTASITVLASLSFQVGHKKCLRL